MKSLLNLIRFCVKGQHPLYIVCLFLGLVMQAISLAQPTLGGDLLVSVVHNSIDSAAIAVILVGLFVLETLLSIIQQMILGNAGEAVVRKLRNELTKKVFSLSVLEFEKRSAGWYSQRLISDVDLVRCFPERVLRIAQSAVMLLGSLIVLASLDITTFLVGLALGLLSLCFAAAASKPIETATDGVQDNYSSIATILQDAFQANRVLRSLNAWDAKERQIMGQISNLYTLGLNKVRVVSFLFPVSSTLMHIANVGTIMFGAVQVAHGVIDFSDLIVFLMYFSYFSSSISQIASSVQQLREARVGSRRIMEFLAICEGSLTKRIDSQDLIGAYSSTLSLLTSPVISFEHVTFSYPDSGTAALNEVTFKVPAEKTTALVGASGGGKTTCLSLIERFYSPSEGSIYINGNLLNCIDIHELRSSTGYIDQNLAIVRGTIRTNLLLAKRNASDDELNEALKLAGLENYSDNLDYEVGENGLNLSGGQRQKLALARTILKDPKLLLMDEPTASLDGISETEYSCLLRQQFPKATILYATHRASLITNADWIVVINDGSVVGQGNHASLLKTCPYYRRLFESLQGNTASQHNSPQQY